MRKEIILLLLASFLSTFVSLNAQTKRILLFDEYYDGVVLFKNKSKVYSKLNYDTANKKMMYLQSDKEMILVNTHQVDTVYINKQKFIPIQSFFLEVVEIPNDYIFINWSLKEKYKGNKGAYGQITQNKVETINTSFWTNSEYTNQSTSVYERENSNEYWFYISDKAIKCKREKNLIKALPKYKDDIKTFIRKNKIDFKETPDALKLIEYCLTLNRSKNDQED